MIFQYDDIWDEFKAISPLINTLMIVLVVSLISLLFVQQVGKATFVLILGFFSMALIYLYAYGTLPQVYGAGGFILLALLLVIVIRGKNNGST